MKKLPLLISLFLATTIFAQSKDELAIRNLLNDQIAAWNKGDLEGYMQGYWKSDSLTFIGKSGIQRGWTKTLINYKKSYPDTAAMGKLSFELISVKKLSPEYFYVIGKWMLERSIGNLSGHYDLLLRKIKGKWVIISDHSS